VVKYVGAAYLIYLGVRMLLSRTTSEEKLDAGASGATKALRDGALVEAMNVKTAIFFLAFLPQFVVVNEPVMPQIVLMGTVCVLLNTLVDVIAVFAAARILRSATARAAREKLLTRLSGFTMIGLGVYLAAAKRNA
jgi:threonine/homoserine/homoserine lactone efflux protein